MTDATVAVTIGISLVVSLTATHLYLSRVRPWLVRKGVVPNV